jgi:hypothetical protein
MVLISTVTPSGSMSVVVLPSKKKIRHNTSTCTAVHKQKRKPVSGVLCHTFFVSGWDMFVV